MLGTDCSRIGHIAQWKHIVAIDLTNTFYQIPLSHSSMKYCSITTLFQGVYVHVCAQSAMDMPGSEMALEELMYSVLGNLEKKRVCSPKLLMTYTVEGTPHKISIRIGRKSEKPPTTMISASLRQRQLSILRPLQS